MAATLARLPGIPRWVGVRITTTPGTRHGNELQVAVSAKVPPIRGFLYNLWLAKRP